jgi:hypothetical protein
MIERGHKLLINTLSKMINGGFRNWVDNLPAILQTDRFIIRRSIGHIPFYLLYGREPVLPIKLNVPIWRIFFRTRFMTRLSFLLCAQDRFNAGIRI